MSVDNKNLVKELSHLILKLFFRIDYLICAVRSKHVSYIVKLFYFQKRGRKAPVDSSELLSAILQYRDDVIVSNRIAFPSSKVWIDRSTKFENKMSPKAIYTYIKKNRHGIWSNLGLSVITKESTEQLIDNNYKDDLSEDSGDSDFHKDDLSEDLGDSQDKIYDPETLTFIVKLSSDEWKQIAPDVISYARREKRRDYFVLKRGTWTHVLNSQIWKTIRLRCTFAFKRCKINPNGQNYATLFGTCTECKCLFKGTIHEQPKNDISGDNSVSVSCTITGSFMQLHTMKKKRHLSGSRRNEAVRKMRQENVSATLYRTTEASACMNMYDPEPSHIPKLNVLRTAKCKEIAKAQHHNDPIIAISYLLQNTNRLTRV